VNGPPPPPPSPPKKKPPPPPPPPQKRGEKKKEKEKEKKKKKKKNPPLSLHFISLAEDQVEEEKGRKVEEPRNEWYFRNHYTFSEIPINISQVLRAREERKEKKRKERGIPLKRGVYTSRVELQRSDHAGLVEAEWYREEGKEEKKKKKVKD